MKSIIDKDIKNVPFHVLNLLEEEIYNNKLLRTEISKLKIENDRLKAELAKYESPNIPSSKQLFSKAKKRRVSGMPRTTKRKRGGSQKGDEKWYQQLPPKDVKLYVGKCNGCSKVVELENQLFDYSKSVIDMPEKIILEHTKYHVYKYKCECGIVTKAKKPTLEETSIGPNLLSLNQTIRFRTGASFEKISELIYDQTGIKISQTAIHRGYTLVCDTLEPVANKIATGVMNSEYINIDETGHKLVLEGKQSYKKSKKVWVWVAGTPTSAFYHVDLTRSKKAIEKMFKFIIPENPPPISVSDAYSAYINSFPIKEFCWSHLLRESKDIECICEDGRIIHLELTELYRRIKSLRSKLLLKGEVVSDKVYSKVRDELNEIAEAPSCDATDKIRKHLNRRAENYITCLKHPNIPMTNNHAERLLRTVIVHRSNGKPFRSIQAMKQYATMLTVMMTWKLQKKPIASSLRSIIEDELSQSELTKK